MGTIFKILLWSAVLAGLVLGVLRLTVLRWWTIPEDDPVLAASIEPSLHAGDMVLLWRATAPNFGSIVVCPDPEDAGRIVIGRLVGEERDKLVIDGARVHVNDHEAHTETACAERTFRILDPNTGSEIEEQCDIEALGGVAHKRGWLEGANAVRQVTTREVGEGNVYLVSDNRAYPYDSRNYGSVERATCRESVFFRVVSKDGFMDVRNRFDYIR